MEQELRQMHNSCLRCGRPLRSEQSARRGYGPVCYKKAKEDPNLIDLLAGPAKDEQNFMDELQERRKVKAG